MDSPAAAVVLEDVTKVYEMGQVSVTALEEIDLEIEEGRFVVFLGPSGSGKTTLMNLIGGLDKPTSGRLQVYGRELTELDDHQLTAYRREEVGFVFQFFNLVPTLTALENVQLIADLVDSSRDAEELLTAVGLGDLLDRFPSQLSGGQQQRVAIARALVKQPKMLLGDEPTGNLDQETSEGVLRVIHEMAEKVGTTVILVTHDETISSDAEVVVRLRSGRIDDVSQRT
ncbi:MAG: ABC transporter ATP-binding protein [Armatimonadota bacterium]